MRHATTALLLTLAAAMAEPAASLGTPNLPALLSPRDYGFGFFPQGWRRDTEDDPTKDLLRFETGYYGFEIDVDDIQHPRFGLIDDGMGALEALAAGAARSDTLEPGKLSIEIEKDGRTYRAVRCQAGKRTDAKRMGDIHLWESGTFAQHYELHNVEFADDQGVLLGGGANLRLVGWPDSLAFTAEITPAPLYKEGPVIGATQAGRLLGNEGLVIPHSEEIDPAHFTLEGWMKLPEQWAFPLQKKAWLACKNQHPGKDGFFGLYLDKDTPAAALNIGGGGRNAIVLKSRHSLAKGKWSHLALTFDGRKAVFYVDGKPAGSAEINRQRSTGGGAFFIGRDMSPAEGDRLLLDDVRLWNRVLPPKEISARYAKSDLNRNTEGLVFEETFGSEVPPAEAWTDATVSLSFAGAGRDWQTSQTIAADWPEGMMKPVTLVCDFADRRLPTDAVAIRMVSHDFPVAYDAVYNAQVARVKGLQRRKPTDDPGLREYDDLVIEVENTGGKSGTVPFVLDVERPKGITGIHPTLCFEDGRPTGVPVQIGKNWHCSPSYFRAFTLLPAPVGTTRYLLRLSYGFYGTVPQVSHSQLSLLGWGGNARWDQVAIGAWGETICFDIDHSLTRGFVTDNRGMLVRNGADGPPWQWTEAGWGGDWLTVRNADGEKLDPVAMKTLYVAHGPCLSEVEYSGQFGHGGEVGLRSTVRVPRTDDHVRTFFTNTYDFHAALPTSGSWLFKMGNSHNYSTPRVCYGNRDGLLGEQLPLPGAKKGDTPLDRHELAGAGPWWIAFPESKAHLPPGRERFGTAAKALIIRSHKATYGGKPVNQPSISLVVNTVQPDGRMDYSLLLTPPAGLVDYQPGDKVELDVEWITVPHNAADYYGPNEALRKHLAESPGSWKTIHREALGNDLNVTATGGTVTSTYPVIVEVEAPEVALEIQGGVGHVPVRFDGLTSVKGFKLHEIVNGERVALDQAVKGNDFWQTDHDATTGTYRLTYNIPLDGKPSSRWVLKQAE